MPRQLASLLLILLGAALPRQTSECTPNFPRGTGAQVESVREVLASFSGGADAIDYTYRIRRHDIVRVYFREDGSVRRRVIAGFVSHEQFRPAGDGPPPSLAGCALPAPAERGFPLPTALNALDFLERSGEFLNLEGKPLAADLGARLARESISEERLLALLPARIAANAEWAPSVNAAETFFAPRQMMPVDLISPLRIAVAAMPPAAKVSSPTHVVLSGSGKGSTLRGTIDLHAAGAPLSIDVALDAVFPVNTRTIQFQVRLAATVRATVTWASISDARIGRIPETEWFLRSPTVADYQSLADDAAPKYLQALTLARDGSRARLEEAYHLYRGLLARDRNLTPSPAFADLDLWFGRLSRQLGYADSALFAFGLAASSAHLLGAANLPLERAETRLLQGAPAADLLIADLVAAAGSLEKGLDTPGPERGRINYLHGRALASKGDWASAAKRFDTAASCAISDLPLYKTWLAIAQRELGETAGALKSVRASLNLSPTYRPARILSQECSAAIDRGLDVIVTADDLISLGTYHLRSRTGATRPLPPLVGLRLRNLTGRPLPLKISLALKDAGTDLVEDLTLPAEAVWTPLAMTPELKSSMKPDRVATDISATASIVIRRTDTNAIIYQSDRAVRFKPRHIAPWRTTDPELNTPMVDRTASLAAWVTPEAKFVSDLLVEAGLPSSGASRPRARALFEFARRRIRVTGETSMSADGNTSFLTLRLPCRVASSREATPLEAALFFCTLLDAAGLSPMLVSASGRILIAWKADEAETEGASILFLDLGVPDGRTFEEALGQGLAAWQSRGIAALRGATEGESWTLDVAALRKAGWRAQPAADEPEKDK